MYAGGFPYSEDACRLRCDEDWFWEFCGCRILEGPHEEQCNQSRVRHCWTQSRNTSKTCYTTCKRTCDYVKYATSIMSGAISNNYIMQLAEYFNFPAQT